MIVWKYKDHYATEEWFTDLCRSWFISNGSKHFCNQVTDPSSCCPVAHGADGEHCTCIFAFKNGRHSLEIDPIDLPGLLIDGMIIEGINGTEQP